MQYIESDTIELKEELSKDLMKEVVAFANTLGGKIYIGISDAGEVVGLKEIKEQLEIISSKIRDKIMPSIVNYVKLQKKIVDGKDIIVIEVQRGEGKPYYLKDKGMRPSGVYIRLGNTSIPVSDKDIRLMVVKSHGVTYETTRSLKQNLTFLYARNQFEQRKLEFLQTNFKTLGMIDEDGLYNNLALLLSDQCPHIVKAAIFEGDNKTKFKHRQEFGGSLLRQMNDVYQYLQMHNHMDTTYEGLRRTDNYDYNPITLREGLLNALIHRDYGVGGSIFVNIFDNYCEFVSLGTLPDGLELEDIMEGVSKPRNEKLANVFYRLELIEAYGTGITKILSAYDGLVAKPEFKITPNAFILRLPKLNQLEEYMTVKDMHEAYNVSSELGTEKHLVNIYDREAVINDIMRIIKINGHIMRNDIQKSYGFSQTKSGSLLREMENLGIIIKSGKGKNTYYQLRK